MIALVRTVICSTVQAVWRPLLARSRDSFNNNISSNASVFRYRDAILSESLLNIAQVQPASDVMLDS